MLISEIDCCGCSACAVSCPQNAIHMDFNENGFFSSVVDTNLCVKCGICEKVCPMLNTSAEKISEKNVFISVARNKIVLEKAPLAELAMYYHNMPFNMACSCLA